MLVDYTELKSTLAVAKDFIERYDSPSLFDNVHFLFEDSSHLIVVAMNKYSLLYRKMPAVASLFENNVLYKFTLSLADIESILKIKHTTYFDICVSDDGKQIQVNDDIYCDTGKYYDWKRFMVDDCNHSITVNTKEFIEKFRENATETDPYLLISDDRIRIHHACADDNEVSLNADGTVKDLILNGNFLIKFFESIDDPYVKLSCSDPCSKVAVYSEKYIYLVMPMDPSGDWLRKLSV